MFLSLAIKRFRRFENDFLFFISLQKTIKNLYFIRFKITKYIRTACEPLHRLLVGSIGVIRMHYTHYTVLQQVYPYSKQGAGSSSTSWGSFVAVYSMR